MKITMPKGVVPPKGVKPGESFESVCTFKQEDDGSFELESVDGAPMEDETMEDEEQIDGEEQMNDEPINGQQSYDSAEGVALPWREK